MKFFTPERDFPFANEPFKLVGKTVQKPPPVIKPVVDTQTLDMFAQPTSKLSADCSSAVGGARIRSPLRFRPGAVIQGRARLN